LIDHVADWRAPTPTAAAERAVPVRADLLEQVASLRARQRRAMARVLQERKLRLQSASRALPKPDDVLAIARQRMDAAAARLPQSLRTNVQRHGLALARISGRLSPKTLQSRLIETRRRVTELQARGSRALKTNLNRLHDRLAAHKKLMNSLSYKAVLARGFAVVRDATGKALPIAAGVNPGSRLQVEFVDATIGVTVDNPQKQGSLF
jgi:exodeoxyribonuclease VII large subunit